MRTATLQFSHHDDRMRDQRVGRFYSRCAPRIVPRLRTPYPIWPESIRPPTLTTGVAVKRIAMAISKVWSDRTRCRSGPSLKAPTGSAA